ncbi:hypothetical protein Clacol_008795 [Clathrus columnatus]|uniref:Fe2OG dioxygenase domain-containing protein n=1 Tax=Clathrus columnatus TaxID=1419009 RepID=A0AAV5ARL5_9AGAM|nr:hypothetical protein Clacol_008795 [Clathrus columnatus]
MAVDKLVDSCVPAPHGRGNQTVYDDSYRLAKELPQNDFSLSLEILSEAGSQVLTTISELISGRGGTSTSDNDSSTLELVPKLYKLNAYSKNGFFKPHRDTPKANNHAGTLLIGLPVAFEGGMLRVAHADKEVKFDWGSKCSEGIIRNNENGDYKLSIPWAFFFSDVEHEVLPVLSGTRVTIAYDIFATRTIIPAKSKIDTTIHTFPLSNDIYSALQNPRFLPEGAKIAIALSHAYPMPRHELTSDDVAANLKGSDAILYRDLKSLGLDVSLEAVIEVGYRQSKAFTDLHKQIPVDEYGPVNRILRRGNGVSTKVYYTSKTFTYFGEDTEYDEDRRDFESFLDRTLKAKFAGDLMCTS